MKRQCLPGSNPPLLPGLLSIIAIRCKRPCFPISDFDSSVGNACSWHRNSHNRQFTDCGTPFKGFSVENGE